MSQQEDKDFANPVPMSNPAAPPKRKVLVVDDSDDARAILKLLLTKLGHTTQTAANGQAGLDVSRDFKPEIVLCDLMMAGGMSGYAFAQAARKEGHLAGVCIVAVSGWEGPEYEKEAYEAGFDRILKKPVGLSDLQEVLRSPPRRTPTATAEGRPEDPAGTR
jgi:CheY-like chemotaxis protein